MSFPSKAILQDEGGYDSLANELRSRGVEVVMRNFEAFLNNPQVTKTDLVVGNHMWTRAALKTLGVATPKPPDYPDCLKHLLYRRIWQSTLGEIATYVQTATGQTFIKPAVDAKTFSAVIEPQDQMLDVFLNGIPGTTMKPVPPNTPVYCAEVVKLLSEYRVYVIDGEIKAVCHYTGDTSLKLDMDVVREAINTFQKTPEGASVCTGCGVDFAVMKSKGDNGEEKLVTCLVEVNDGYSLGVYDGFSVKDQADLLISRWRELVNNGK
eukprot:TRINITY_DN113488_c0_g1_i1.p1 TRINITY_DN113488_c0_g1~~TRINITY_DN113488_c0_g1_i1.p1  ORF type:complete len:266 (-),score=30.22 TRINITY_DN113488_c0_g1_i1:86-883(-)